MIILALGGKRIKIGRKRPFNGMPYYLFECTKMVIKRKKRHSIEVFQFHGKVLSFNQNTILGQTE
jgi:hypothetical protein